jgi:hypothetical protein
MAGKSGISRFRSNKASRQSRTSGGRFTAAATRQKAPTAGRSSAGQATLRLSQTMGTAGREGREPPEPRKAPTPDERRKA